VRRIRPVGVCLVAIGAMTLPASAMATSTLILSEEGKVVANGSPALIAGSVGYPTTSNEVPCQYRISGYTVANNQTTTVSLSDGGSLKNLNVEAASCNSLEEETVTFKTKISGASFTTTGKLKLKGSFEVISKRAAETCVYKLAKVGGLFEIPGFTTVGGNGANAYVLNEKKSSLTCPKSGTSHGDNLLVGGLASGTPTLFETSHG
jgi:hypothetical protein